MPRGRPKGSGKRSGGSAIAGLQSARSALMAQQDKIEKQIAQIDDIMSSFGSVGTAAAPKAKAASGNGRRRRRGPRASNTDSGHRAGSLKDMIHKTLTRSGKPMAVKDIADRVVASGYKSKNKTLAKSVGIALLDMNSVKKVKRGTYAAK